MIDFSKAGPQTETGALLKGGTLARVRMAIQWPDEMKAGDDPALTKSETTPAQYIDGDFTIVSEPFANRKFWHKLFLAGVKDKAINISFSTCKAALCSAKNVKFKPSNQAEETAMIQATNIQSLGEFDGLEFAVKIGIEPAKNGYPAKNKIAKVIVPEDPEYAAIMAGQTTEGDEEPPVVTPAAAPGPPAMPGPSGPPPMGGASPGGPAPGPPQGMTGPPPAGQTPPSTGPVRPSWS